MLARQRARETTSHLARGATEARKCEWRSTTNINHQHILLGYIHTKTVSELRCATRALRVIVLNNAS